MAVSNLALEIEQLVHDILSRRRIPGATYRFQFGKHFTFQDAAELVPYLHQLGVTDAYASPLFKAREGSTHGYDTADYSQFNPALGTQEDFERLVARLREYNMGLVLDIVPNHMGIGQDNDWWMNILEYGVNSPYARYFDINWQPAKRSMHNKVLLPVLGDHYGRVLESGQLRLDYDRPDFSLYYGDLCLPVAIATCGGVLELARQFLNDSALAQHEDALELESIIRAIHNLPPMDEAAPDTARVWMDEQQIIRARLMNLHRKSTDFQKALALALQQINGTADDPRSYDLLDKIILQQPYWLAFWRVAADEINYRRFFDINDMASIRIEFPDVFEAVHHFTFELLQRGDVTGLRIDHPDGLWHPPSYFTQLQEQYSRSLLEQYDAPAEVKDAALARLQTLFGKPEQIGRDWPLYVVAEKILSEIEPLPLDWAVYGTTGYDFLVAVNNLFVNRDHVHDFERLYSHFTGQQFDFRELVYQMKKFILNFSLASEISSRSQQLARLVERTRTLRGFTLNSLRFVLSEIVACMSIYRTYITAPGKVSERDRDYLEQAVEEARRRNVHVPGAVFDFVRDTLLLNNLYDFDEADRPAVIEFVMQFQQITGPVMAKSVEDTSFYIYNRLVSLNEVGGNPEQFGIGVDDFHGHNDWRSQHWPHTLLSLSTHDTKRSADVRARLNALSEMPQAWESAIWRWSEMNQPARTEIDGEFFPTRNDEYLFYQNLLGIWPEHVPEGDDLKSLTERLVNYMRKATHEAKVNTSWVNPNTAYNDAVQRYIETVMADPRFLADVDQFHKAIAYFGWWNSLSQVLLELTSPGVPDIYQGNELWDFSLVDPDNRRPVDYPQRQKLLDQINAALEDDQGQLIRDLVENAQDGRIKLFLTAQTLQFRRDHAPLFDNGSYEPLQAEGDKARHVCAFTRQVDEAQIIVAVPVLNVALADGALRAPAGDVWEDTRLLVNDANGARYQNIFTGDLLTVENGSLALSAVLEQFPVAVLWRVIE